MLAIGDKVKVREEYVLKIAEKNFEVAKFLANNTGIVIGFDEITWHYQIKFEDREYWFRRFKLEKL